MFRLFLISLLNAEPRESTPQQHTPSSLAGQRLRNRRIYERFDIDHKHLALMNEQDILLVRDLSETGFSTEVSKRGLQRFEVGQIYRCRIRYLRELYDADVCVRWKDKSFVGFELVTSSHPIRQFLSRLLRPLEIGSSLQKVDEKFITIKDNEGMSWYHGPHETNFYLWLDEASELRAWQFEEKERFIKWDPISGLVSGKIRPLSFYQGVSTSWQKELIADSSLDGELKQFAADVFMASPFTIKEALIASLFG